MTTTQRRVALLNDVSTYCGPDLARMLASSGHDLVVGKASPEQIAELEALGATVVNLPDGPRARSAEDFQAFVAAGVERFGRIDAAMIFSGSVVVGPFLDSTVEDLQSVMHGCVERPYHFLKAVLPIMEAQNDGQILVITSATAARPTFGAPLYSTARAAATMLAQNVAEEFVRKNIQVNVVGTNFMDFPEFLRATGGNDPAVRAMIEQQVPMRRLGTVTEFAHFCLPYVDGTTRFATGQATWFAGGWA